MYLYTLTDQVVITVIENTDMQHVCLALIHIDF
jgi:hypothetical protein